MLKDSSGGIVFTTIQKFFPEEKGDRHPLLSERRNIVVIADQPAASVAGCARRLDSRLNSLVDGVELMVAGDLLAYLAGTLTHQNTNHLW